MATTTIRLSEELKERVAAAAKRAGTTSHNFILEAIAARTDQEEMRAGFREEALQRFAKIVDSGRTVSWNEMRQYLQARVAGDKPVRPKSRKLAR